MEWLLLRRRVVVVVVVVCMLRNGKFSRHFGCYKTAALLTYAVNPDMLHSPYRSDEQIGVKEIGFLSVHERMRRP